MPQVMERRARTEPPGDSGQWYLQEWSTQCFHPGCREDGHWVTKVYAGIFTEAKAKEIAEKHNRLLRRV